MVLFARSGNPTLVLFRTVQPGSDPRVPSLIPVTPQKLGSLLPLFPSSLPTLYTRGLILERVLETGSPMVSSHYAYKCSSTPLPSSGPLIKAMSPAYPPRPWVPGTFFPVPSPPPLFPSPQHFNTIKQLKTPSSLLSFKDLFSLLTHCLTLSCLLLPALQ